jgi:protein SCO1
MKSKIFLALGLAAGIVLALLAGRLLRPYEFHGTILQSPDPAYNFNLTDGAGQVIKLSDFRGKLVVLYFGYTYCPDVCPDTLTQVNKALEMMGAKAEQVQVMMISVDPERDTPAAMSEYMRHFNPDFIGLTGSPEQIALTAAPYGIYYEKDSSGESAGGYLVNHTASLMVIDRDGHLKLILPYGITAADMAADFQELLK